MNTFKTTAAQGDVLIRRISDIPSDAHKEAIDNRGYYVVAHSETMHDHVIEATPAVTYYTSPDPMVSYLSVVESCDEVETILKHLRSFDTHAPILIPPGNYEIRRQREYVPDGWRQIAD